MTSEAAKVKLQQAMDKIWEYGIRQNPELVVALMDVLEVLANGHTNPEVWKAIAKWTEGKA